MGSIYFDGPVYINGKQNPEYARAVYLAKREGKKEIYKEYSKNYKQKNRDVVLVKDRDCKRKLRKEFPEKLAQANIKSELKVRHKLTWNDYCEMLEDQENKCKICNNPHIDAPRKRLHVDHCHKTGLVRALLCHGCNNLLSRAKDDPEVLRKAMEYLNEHSRDR